MPQALATGKNWVLIALIFVALCVFIAFPVRLIDLGFLPPDDALRYAARAVVGKDWADIIVIRPEITIDHNPGWNLLQELVFGATNWTPRRLVNFSVILLFVVFCATPLFLIRRPEAWVTSLTLMMLVFTYFAERLVLGRPLLLTAAVTLALLSLWQREDHHGKKLWVFTIALIALCVWIHGSWYLLAMVPAAFFLARRWRPALGLTLCWLAGSIVAAFFTGQPWKYLYESALIPVLALGQKVPANALAGEFQAYSGGLPALLLVGLILGARFARGLPLKQVTKDPILWLALIGWVLGYKVFRFWLDWGLPALALWTALQLEELLDSTPALSTKTARFSLAAAAAALLFLFVANDSTQRWSQHSKFEALDSTRPEHAPWLPDKGGILYAVNMSVFYETFFTNPQGEWRYALGFEPSFMLPDDYSVFRELWETLNAIKAVQPWVRKMSPADRLVLLAPDNTPPAIPQLEWKYVVKDTWVGRLPRHAPQNPSL
jgi:hypothetical protein